MKNESQSKIYEINIQLVKMVHLGKKQKAKKYFVLYKTDLDTGSTNSVIFLRLASSHRCLERSIFYPLFLHNLLPTIFSGVVKFCKKRPQRTPYGWDGTLNNN